MSQRPRLAVLISGTGRNLQAILDAITAGQIQAEPVIVISNRPGVAGLERAERAGVPSLVIDHREHPDRQSFDAALDAALRAARVELVALAGFMRILTPEFTRAWRGRMLNIHPSLLPAYRGLHTHQRVLAAGDAWHGASIHYVSEELDGGPVVLQGRIPVYTGDDADSLADRLMREVELHLFPLALSWAASGRLSLEGGKPLLDGQPLDEPVIYAGAATTAQAGPAG